jgi:hypothetical protein
MRKLYISALLLCGTAFFANSQSVVLINTDWSDANPAIPVATNGDGTTSYSVTGGAMMFKTCKYNDTNNPTIGTTVMNPATDNTVRYMRIGSSFTPDANGYPTNQYFNLTPTNAFVNGGKVTLTVSVNATGKGINVYNMTDKTLLGTIDISGIALNAYTDVTFTIPASLSGIKSIGFTRAEITGAVGGATFFTWKVKVETFEVGTSVNPATTIGNVVSTQYYSLTGALVATKYAELAPGIYLQKSTFDNGKVSTVKVSKAKQ